MDAASKPATSDDFEIRYFYLAAYGYERCVDLIHSMASPQESPGFEYFCATIVKYTNKRDYYRIVGFLVKPQFPSNFGLFRITRRGFHEPEHVRHFWIQQVAIYRKARDEKEQKIAIKIRGKSHTVRSFIKWIWSLGDAFEGASPAKFEFGNKYILLKVIDYNKVFTEAESEAGVCGCGHFPKIETILEEVK
jgi:hypothetical protein